MVDTFVIFLCFHWYIKHNVEFQYVWSNYHRDNHFLVEKISQGKINRFEHMSNRICWKTCIPKFRYSDDHHGKSKTHDHEMNLVWKDPEPQGAFVQNCIHLHFLGRNIRLIWYKSSILKYLGQVCCPKESHNIQPQFWRCISQKLCLWGPNQAVILEVIPLFPLIWLIC